MPTPQKILCPHCRLALPFEEARAGMAVKCRYCGERFVMPRITPPGAQQAHDAPRQQAPQPSFIVPPPGSEPARPPVPTVPVYPAQGDVGWHTDQQQADASGRAEWNPAPGEQPGASSYLAENDELSQRVPPQWQTVASALGTIQFGYILALLAALGLGIVAGSVLTQPGYGYPGSYYFSPWGFGPNAGPLPVVLCGSGGCIVLSLLLVVIGQAMLCATPEPPVRNSAIGSLILLLIGLVMYFFQIAMATSPMSYYRNPTSALSMTLLVGVIGFALLVASHLFFVIYLQGVASYFRDSGTGKQVTYYLVFYIVYLGISLFAGIAALSGSGMQYSPYYYSSRANQDLFGLAAVCWGCFGIFLVVALLALIQQTRSLVRDRLTTGLRGGRMQRK
jgi:hypothetical protein